MAYSFSANFNIKRDVRSCNPVTGYSVNDRDRLGVSAEFLYMLSDRLWSVRVTADYDEYDEICCAVEVPVLWTSKCCSSSFWWSFV